MMNESKTPNSPFLKTLTKHIAGQLKERGFCVVFEDDLDRCWPSSGMSRAEREREIQHFAESQGWIATILNSALGTRAIVEKRETGAVDFEGSLCVPS